MNGSYNVRLLWLKDVLLASCVKMCGKCWVTHRCCRHMETQQIRLEGCPGSLLSPHRCRPPEGTWAGSHSSSQGCPGCPWLLTSEPEERIGDSCLCPSLMPKTDPNGPWGSLSLLCQVYLWKGVKPNPQTDQIKPFPTLSVQIQKCTVFKTSSRNHSSSLKMYKCFNRTARLFTFLNTSSFHR